MMLKRLLAREERGVSAVEFGLVLPLPLLALPLLAFPLLALPLLALPLLALPLLALPLLALPLLASPLLVDVLVELVLEGSPLLVLAEVVELEVLVDDEADVEVKVVPFAVATWV